MIQTNRLSKKYKGADFFSVDSLDLRIDEGEIFGLLGPNGAGKTTLISMLCSLLRPTSGTFTIDGLSYRGCQDRLRRSIGIVPQEYALYPSLTAYENLVFFSSMYGLRGKALRESIDRHLQTMGLSSFAHKRIASFSGGMKRRVNLIAGMLHRPKVLFLDEPTVGVDVQSKNVIVQHLKQLNAQGMTLVYTSHHLNEAENLCHRVAIIDHGRAICSGTPHQLVSEHKGARNLEEVFLALTGKALRDHA